MKRLGIDLDGVVVDFVNGFFAISNKMFNTDYKEQTNWDFEQYSREQVDAVWKEIKATRNFWRGLQPEKGTISLAYMPPKGIEYVFITSRIPTKGDSPRVQSCNWLNAYFMIEHPFVIVVDNPSEKIPLCRNLGIEVFIDDKPSTVLQMHNAGIRTYLRLQPYNRQIYPAGVIQVENLDSFIQMETICSATLAAPQ